MSDPLFVLNRDCPCGGHFESSDLTETLNRLEKDLVLQKGLLDGDTPEFALFLKDLFSSCAAARRWDNLISDENIEAAAKALLARDNKHRHIPTYWDGLHPQVQDEYRDEARAALMAVKSLSEKGTPCPYDCDNGIVYTGHDGIPDMEPCPIHSEKDTP